MCIRKLLAWITVLVLASLACQATSTIVNPTEPEPTSTPIPPPTNTAVVVEPTATQPPPPTESPTPDRGSAPVIRSVDLRTETSGNEMTVYQDISFQDADGDANKLNYDLLSATTEGLVVEDGAINVSPQEQKIRARITGTWNCGDGNYEARLRITLVDKKGNQSEASEYTIVCGLGDVQGGFPDPFDDNRNTWGVSENIFIQDGALRFRKSLENTSDWIYCNNCIVTPDQNSVSVEASWSNTENRALGLLIDHKMCTPDGLIFVIGPIGYYSILQAVRDEAGEWRHWRTFIDWTKSSKIRKAPDQVNLLSAEYEFDGEALHVKFYLNGTYITRVEVFGYNGAMQCRPGLFSDSGLESNFDNFSIPAVK
jgi:hypothetical protein